MTNQDVFLYCQHNSTVEVLTINNSYCLVLVVSELPYFKMCICVIEIRVLNTDIVICPLEMNLSVFAKL